MFSPNMNFHLLSEGQQDTQLIKEHNRSLSRSGRIYLAWFWTLVCLASSGSTSDCQIAAVSLGLRTVSEKFPVRRNSLSFLPGSVAYGATAHGMVSIELDSRTVGTSG